jgi:hypothetical protein
MTTKHFAPTKRDETFNHLQVFLDPLKAMEMPSSNWAFFDAPKLTKMFGDHPTKINLPKFTRLWCKVWIHMQNFFNMSKLPNCERDNLKSFINILRAYGLDQQKESKIGIL